MSQHKTIIVVIEDSVTTTIYTDKHVLFKIEEMIRRDSPDGVDELLEDFEKDFSIKKSEPEKSGKNKSKQEKKTLVEKKLSSK